MTRVLLLSTYEQGHQPLGLAAPAAALRAAGHLVTCRDLSVEDLALDDLVHAELVGISVPMHTAARLGVALARRIRATRPQARIAFYGLYADPLDGHLRAHGLADVVCGGDYEPALVALADAAVTRPPAFARRAYPVPDRTGLPPLDRYARFDPGAGDHRLAGYVEATRGCAHRCTHCPLTPTWGGRLRLVGADTVLADVDQQVALGARHITFGDPDFLNAAPHADAISAALHRRHPDLTFDATVKAEHLLEHAARLPRLQERGLVFVTTAFESCDDALLARLDKGHTRADLDRVVALADRLNLPLHPTWLPFTPWTSPDDFVAILDFIAAHGFAHRVPAVQLGLRLLLPPGSPLIAAAAADGHLTGFDPDGLTHTWRHPHPAMDDLQRQIAAHAAATDAVHTHASSGDHRASDDFERIVELTRDHLGLAPCPAAEARPPAPTLTERWFC